MSYNAAFESVRSPEGEPGWRRLEDPPRLISFGKDDFIVASSGRRGSRAYVNGCRVYGMAVLRPGDFVLVRSGGSLVSYRVTGRMATAEHGEGMTCAFTRLPISGPAVRCPCGAAVGQAAAVQVGSCPLCGLSLATGDPNPPDGEEIL